MDRLATSEISIIIACDGVPAGLREVVEEVCKVAAGAFSIEVLELRLYQIGDDLVCLPVGRIQTQVVQRIQVTTTSTGVEVRATPLEEVEQAKATSEAPRRQWDWPSFSARLRETGGDQAVQGARFIADWFAQNADDVFYMNNVGGSFIPVFVDGPRAPLPFTVQAQGAKLAVQLRISTFPKFTDPGFVHGLTAHLNALPGVNVSEERVMTAMPSVPLSTFANPAGQIAGRALFEWVMSQVGDWRPVQRGKI